MYRVDLTERYLFICIIFFVYIYQYTQSQSPGNNNPDRSKKHLEELEETNEDLREKELEKIYSASKAHQFLSHDKCMQRMKCPANRKEECSEECKAGNTEEEIEEHNELTRSEHRSSFSRTPKQKYDSHKDLKKRSNTTPSLSIEERVKLRRTKPFQTPIIPLLNKKIQSKLIKPNKTIIKSKKFFLGSGLDLDNIVLGNRQRRSIKT
ncbi:unnamed protein product [Rotaria sp. Silwood1]|nr:unnamed protein product [Rotaria sp. Silwood1]